MKRKRRIAACTVLTCLTLLSVTCSPSPRYLSKAEKPEPPIERKAKPPVRKPSVERLIFPVNGFEVSRVTSLYGLRKHPRYDTRGFHTGIDIDAEVGDEVIAAASGKIIFSGNQRGYGKVLIIEHDNDICTVYAHLSTFAVASGNTVNAGQLIGRVGVTGNATGSHLHFEVRIDGKTVDPFEYLPRHR